MNLVHQTSEKIIISDENEKFPPAFYCTGGCGGALLSSEHRHSWENGECIGHETCSLVSISCFGSQVLASFLII